MKALGHSWRVASGKNTCNWVWLDLPAEIRSKVLEFGEKIDKEDLCKSEADNGLESDPHITVKYGLLTDNTGEIRDCLSGEKGGTVRLCTSTIFETDEYDVVKITVDSDDLFRIHEALNRLPHEDEHPDYNAHVTVGYVKKGKGKKYKGKFRISDSFRFKEVSFGRERKTGAVNISLSSSSRGNWYRRAQNKQKEPWEMTLSELRDSLLFHGTVESFEGDPDTRSGGGMLWTAEGSDTAQNYIPSSHGLMLVHIRSYSLDDHVCPSGHMADILDSMGIKYEIFKGDRYRAESWGYPGLPLEQWPTYRDVLRYLSEDLGYSPEKGMDYSFRIKIESGRIMRADETSKGRLFLFSGKGNLRLYDMMSQGESGDLLDPDYNRFDLFHKLQEKGYDGVRIWDYAQSEIWGNTGHVSVGLFPSGLRKMKVAGVVEAVNFDWPEDRLKPTNTKEFVAWHKSLVEQALQDGRSVPPEVLKEHGLS